MRGQEYLWYYVTFFDVPCNVFLQLLLSSQNLRGCLLIVAMMLVSSSEEHIWSEAMFHRAYLDMPFSLAVTANASGYSLSIGWSFGFKSLAWIHCILRHGLHGSVFSGFSLRSQVMHTVCTLSKFRISFHFVTPKDVGLLTFSFDCTL